MLQPAWNPPCCDTYQNDRQLLTEQTPRPWPVLSLCSYHMCSSFFPAAACPPLHPDLDSSSFCLPSCEITFPAPVRTTLPILWYEEISMIFKKDVMLHSHLSSFSICTWAWSCCFKMYTCCKVLNAVFDGTCCVDSWVLLNLWPWYCCLNPAVLCYWLLVNLATFHFSAFPATYSEWKQQNAWHLKKNTSPAKLF